MLRSKRTRSKEKVARATWNALAGHTLVPTETIVDLPGGQSHMNETDLLIGNPSGASMPTLQSTKGRSHRCNRKVQLLVPLRMERGGETGDVEVARQAQK